MRKFDVPVYASKVHFSDACRIISYNAVLKTYKNEPKDEDNPQSMKFENYDPNVKSEERIEEQIKEKLKYRISLDFSNIFRIKSEYVNKTLARGWMNRYGSKNHFLMFPLIFSVIKKLQKDAKQNNSGGHIVQTTSYYAGKYIYTFWKK